MCTTAPGRCFFVLCSVSCSDGAAKKEELLYTRVVTAGRAETMFLGCQSLPDGSGLGIITAYKRCFAAVGLPVDQWIPKLFWFCADGVSTMQGTVEGVYGRLLALQQKVAGYAVVVSFHANSHRAGLGWRDVLDEGHDFVSTVSEGMQQAAAFFNHAPARLRLFFTILHKCTDTQMDSLKQHIFGRKNKEKQEKTRRKKTAFCGPGAKLPSAPIYDRSA